MLHQIGIGALGPVFRTYEPTRDRLVAVKVFRLDIVPEQAQALATALGRAANASLFHPSIVEPIAAGVEGTLAYRAEEYVAAESLDVAMRHYAPAPIEKVLPFITQLAGAIDFARAAGVGHGALHPRDIFVTPDDARATGFGVIEALEEVGIRAPVRRPYTAPERIEGKSWSTPADIFSLAAITFELLTGRRPAGTGALIGALPDSEFSAALHAVLARAMHDDPSQRYGSALAFAGALESAGRGQPEAPLPAAAAAAAAVPPRRELVVEPEPEPPVQFAEPEWRAEPAEPEHPSDHPARAHPAPVPPEKPARPEKTVAPVEPVLREPLLFGAASEERYADRFADEFNLDETVAEPAAQAARPKPVEPPEPLAPLERLEPLEPLEPSEPQEPLERLAPEPMAPSEPVEPWEPALESHMYDAAEPSRPAVLPTAIGVVLGLLAGFAGGYFVGSRDRLAPDTPAATAPTATTATRDQPGQYSEQKVTPPPPSATPTTGESKGAEPKIAEPPPVVHETEPVRGAVPKESAPSAARERPNERTNERTRTTGTIVVKSTPSRAGVTVNGKWRGRTPLTLDRLAFGRYTVRIVQPGYRVAQEEFSLGARDADRTFTAKLEPTAAAARRETPAPKSATAPAGGFFGTLYVDSRPRGATVLLDGKNLGVTPLSVPEIPVGSHVLRVELAGKKPWTSTTTITSGETSRVTMSLEDK